MFCSYFARKYDYALVVIFPGVCLVKFFWEIVVGHLLNWRKITLDEDYIQSLELNNQIDLVDDIKDKTDTVQSKFHKENRQKSVRLTQKLLFHRTKNF